MRCFVLDAQTRFGRFPERLTSFSGDLQSLICDLSDWMEEINIKAWQLWYADVFSLDGVTPNDEDNPEYIISMRPISSTDSNERCRIELRKTRTVPPFCPADRPWYSRFLPRRYMDE